MSEVHQIPCCDMLDHLCDFLDGDLEPEIMESFNAHLAGCLNCQIVVNTVNKTIQLCKDGTQQIKLPQDVHQRLLAELGLDQVRD